MRTVRVVLGTFLIALALLAGTAHAENLVLTEYDEMIEESLVEDDEVDELEGEEAEGDVPTEGVPFENLVAEGEVQPIDENYAAVNPSQQMYVTMYSDVKNQGPLGTCWAFAGVSAIESAAIVKGIAPQDASVADISELAAAYYSYQQDGERNYLVAMAAGGSPSCLADEMMSQTGPIWENGIFGGFSKSYLTSGTQASILNTYSGYVSSGVFNQFYGCQSNAIHVTGYYILSTQDINDIKTMLQEKGACAVSLRWNLGENMTTTPCADGRYAYSMTSDNSHDSGHALTIIGWDDNYPKTNFRLDKQPSSNGAWLVKNSWGASYQYFWVSYETMSGYGSNAVFFEVESNSVGGMIQQVGRGSSALPVKQTNGTAGAMVLTAPCSGTIDSVCVYSDSGVATVGVTVRAAPTTSGNPESGVLLSSGSSVKKYAGFQSITLDEPVSVIKGNQYSIIVSITRPNGTKEVYAERQCSSYNTFLTVLTAGQSFIKIGTQWSDTFDTDTSESAVAIKAHYRNDVTAIELSGLDRYATATAAVANAWPSGSGGVIIVSGEDYPDSLSAAGLSGALDWPVLNTKKASLPTATSSAISHLKAGHSGFKVVIIGGTAAVSTTVENSLKSLCGSSAVERVYGTTRYDTNMAVYQYGVSHGGWGDYAIVCKGSDFPDPLAASALAARTGSPLLFVSESGASSTLKSAVSHGGFIKVLIIGGPLAVSDAVAQSIGPSIPHDRIYGVSRYATSAAIAQWGIDQGYFTVDSCGFVCGETWTDALCAGPAQAKLDGPLFLVNCSNHPSNAYVLEMVRLKPITQVWWYAGPLAMREAARGFIIDTIS